MPRINPSAMRKPTRGPNGTVARRLKVHRPMTLWFLVRRLFAALLHGIFDAAALTAVAYVFFDEWKWVIFIFSIPFGMLAWLIFAKRPTHPEGGSGYQLLDWLVRGMLADLPVVADNITSPIIVGLAVLITIPYVVWQQLLLGVISPGGACFAAEYGRPCWEARGVADTQFWVWLMAMVVPAVMAAILHRKVLREIIFHKPGYASKDDQGAPGPLTSMLEWVGRLTGIRWLSRYNPRALDLAFVVYLGGLGLLLLASAGLNLWTWAEVSSQTQAFFTTLRP